MDDLEDMHAYRSLPEVARYQYWEPMSRDHLTGKVAEWSLLDGQDGRNLTLGVVLRSSGRLIGDIMILMSHDEARQGEVGFTLHPDFQRKGFATEAVTALIDLSFDQFGLHRIFGCCDARNAGSYGLMEKLGMRREAHFREHARFKGGWDEEYVYAILEDEWRMRGETRH